MQILLRLFIALFSATAMSVRGYRKGSLSFSGSLAAFLVGFTTFLSSFRFGLSLLSFYLSATRMTRYKAHLKSKLEDGHQTARGNRNALQVFASALPASIIAIIFCILYGDADAFLMHVDHPSRTALGLSYLLFLSACAGDTFSSEIGIVMPKEGTLPVLLSNPWKHVPRGTNGAVSLQGTIASVLGGFIIGCVFFVTGNVYGKGQAWLILIGAVGGFVGSLVDSLIGGWCQASWLDTKLNKVLKQSPTREMLKEKGRFVHICGNDLFNGEAVNLISALITASCAPVFVPMFNTKLV